jgi:hypothetical protein
LQGSFARHHEASRAYAATHSFRIPANAEIDIRVIDHSGCNLDQHLVRCQLRRWQVVSILKHFKTTMLCASMNDRMWQLEAERQALQKAEEAVRDAAAPFDHPNLAELYRR